MADWMAQLPLAAQDKPLMTLAIPGSHHSGTYNLKEDSEITPDQPWCVRALNPNDMIRRAVYNWSKDQSLNIRQQLEAGVRFLDVTVAYINENIYVVHGLRCMAIRDLFRQVNDFVNIHTKEIVLIDINRFYEFRESHHEKLFNMIDAIFGNKLVHRPPNARNALSYSLNKLWTGLGQVIIFYQPSIPIPLGGEINGHAGPSDVIKLPNFVWTRQFIKNPWPRTEEPQKMIEEVADIINSRDLDEGFQACQAIVTLTVKSVIRQPTGTFEARYARRATRALVDWIRQQGYRYRSNINVLLADFVDEENFCDAVIDLNK